MRMIQQMISWLPQLLNGAKITILLTLCAVSMGLLLSIFLALGKMSKNKILSGICSVYIFFFRGLPQINMALTINSRFFAAFLAFSLNSAAYCSEFIRAAIQSIDRGQFEASKALGLSKAQTMQLVIFPQSIRRLVPSVANEFIMVLKDASLVSIIALADLTKVTRAISSSTGTAMVYIPAMIIYLVMTAFFEFIFRRMETKFSRYE